MTEEKIWRSGVVARSVGYRTLRRYKARSAFVFSDVPLKGCRVLDVGCGRGSMALWAAIHGASFVMGLEPESAGSTAGTSVAFRGLVKDLGLENSVVLYETPLMDLSIGKPFDLAILYNVINHLDEPSVVRLHSDLSAADQYLRTIRHLRSLLRDGALVIVADCARSSFWSRFGLRGPLTHDIEWEKHQDPEVWAALFERAGFRLRELRWSPLYPFGRISSNRLVQYFTTSHFVLTFVATGP